MIDLKILRSNPELFAGSIKKRGAKIDIEELSGLDKKDRELTQKIESLNQLRNKKSEEAAKLRREHKDIGAIQKEMESVKEQIKELEDEKNGVSARLSELAFFMPNILDDSVPSGSSADDNKVVRVGIEPVEKDFKVLEHWEIGEKLGILDFKRASKLSGSRFALICGRGCALERALINFMVDTHVNAHGYKEMWPPFLVTAETMTGTGQLPKFAEELFRCKDDDLYLIPTAEVPVTNIHRDEILQPDELPIKYVSYTACFRREAGSYGKDTKGLIRNHQFNKVELVKFVHPEGSLEELESLLKDACRMLELLNLPYRVIELCGGDIGFSSAKTYDIEVWMSGEKTWREISSCSLFTDFQARRLGIRFKDQGKKTRFVHTLNGSGLAVGRCMAAILENCQTKEGRIVVPEVLHKYLSFKEI